MKRRGIISSAFSAVSAMIGSQLNSFAFAEEDTAQRDMLLVVFLRGGCDGLSLVAPAADKDYIAARGGNLAVTTSGNNKGWELNNTYDKVPFWLHPKAAGFYDLYQNKDLAIVHACGLTHGTRSHFDAVAFMERGTPEDKYTKTGWLTRHLESIHATGITPAFSIGRSTPVSLLGANSAISLTELNDFNVVSDKKLEPLLRRLYEGDSFLHQAGKNTLRAIDFIKSKARLEPNGDFSPYQTSIVYPTGWPVDNFAKSLKTVAQLVKMDVGLQVATIDFDGWDHHEGQNYIFPLKAEALSQGLTAFYNDMHAYHKRLTIVVMSEFGRRLKSNESWGTDHGHGGAMMVLGGNILGGQMYGKWPGLATEQLDNRVDLSVTTDYRSVLSEILRNRLANPTTDQVFPGLQEGKALGFCKV